MKRIIVLFTVLSLLGVVGCKRKGVNDPTEFGPSEQSMVVTGSANPASLLVDGINRNPTMITFQVKDFKNQPLSNRMVVITQTDTFGNPVTWGYFDNYNISLQRITNANGYVSATFFGPLIAYQEQMRIRAHVLQEGRDAPSGTPLESIPVHLMVTNPASRIEVYITSPTAGSYVEGDIEITALVYATAGVSYVHAYIDGAIVALLTKKDKTNPADPTYTYQWDSSTFIKGWHTMSVVAGDPVGNTAEDSVRFFVEEKEDSGGTTSRVTKTRK